MKLTKIILGLAITATVTGCSGLHDAVDKQVNGFHSSLTACEAWCEWSWCYDELDHPADFAAGFKAGYQDVLNGGAGCQPTLPPRHYWKPCYRNAEGHCQINAWFEGFSHGAVAAQQDGANAYGSIPLSPRARTNLQMQATPIQPVNWSHTPAAPLPAPAATEPTVVPSTPAAPPAGAPIVPDMIPPQPPMPTYEDDENGLPTPGKPTETAGRVVLPSIGG